MSTTYTTNLQVTFKLDSLSPNPPYEVAECKGVVTLSDNSQIDFDGWNAMSLGTLDSNGAPFSLLVKDTSYSSGTNATNVGNWALTFIPRSGTSQQSPFDNNKNTITGSGGANLNGVFTLDLGNVKIKSTGEWDWALMIQFYVPVPNSPGEFVTKCFSSDPEMEVGG